MLHRVLKTMKVEAYVSKKGTKKKKESFVLLRLYYIYNENFVQSSETEENKEIVLIHM